MTNEIQKPETSIVTRNGEPIAMRTLLEENGAIEYATEGNAQITVTLELLLTLTRIPKDTRQPTTGELMMFARTCIAQGLDPYIKDCWLVWMPKAYAYQAIVSAQKRIAKAQSMPDYEGYEWGWVTKDGTRHKSGQESQATVGDIIGAWGRVFRAGHTTPFYHEVFTSEYKVHNALPMTMLLKVCRDQTHRYAYADQMGNLLTENEAKFVRTDNGAKGGPCRSQKLLDGDGNGEGRNRSPVQEQEQGEGHAPGLSGGPDARGHDVQAGRVDQEKRQGGNVHEHPGSAADQRPDTGSDGQAIDPEDEADNLPENEPEVAEEPEPATQEEFLYHCKDCGQNFDQPFVKDPKGARTTCCPSCKSDKLVAWEDYVLSTP